MFGSGYPRSWTEHVTPHIGQAHLLQWLIGCLIHSKRVALDFSAQVSHRLPFFLIMGAFWLASSRGQQVVANSWESRHSFSFTETLFTFVAVPAIVVVVNLVGDYFSLWESRIIISRMVTLRGVLRRSGIFALDLVATFAIYCVSLFIACLPVGFAYMAVFDDTRTTVWSLTLNVFRILFLDGTSVMAGNPNSDFLAICLYTSLLTSVWVWTFSLGLILWPTIGGLASCFNTQYRPVGAAMTIGGILFGLLVMAGAYARILF